jgi:hypothetical protein
MVVGAAEEVTSDGQQQLTISQLKNRVKLCKMSDVVEQGSS